MAATRVPRRALGHRARVLAAVAVVGGSLALPGTASGVVYSNTCPEAPPDAAVPTNLSDDGGEVRELRQEMVGFCEMLREHVEQLDARTLEAGNGSHADLQLLAGVVIGAALLPSLYRLLTIGRG